MSLKQVSVLLHELDAAVKQVKSKKLQSALAPHADAMLKVIFKDCKDQHQKNIKKIYKPRAKSDGLSLADAAVKEAVSEQK